MKFAVVAPAATVTDAGTVKAAVALLDNATLVPPAGAAFEIVTVHVVVEDAAGVVLPHCRDVTVICVVTVSVVGWVDPLRAAVIVAAWSDVTAAAVAVNVAVVAPAATVTDAGTVKAAVALLDNATLVPPVGAAFEIVTVHVVVEDAVGVVLPHCTDVTVICVVTVSVVGWVEPLRAAVMVAVWFDVTAAAVAVKVAVVAPAATVTDAGTVKAAVALLDNATLVPPVGAAFEIVTVHVVAEDAAGVVLPHCKDVTVICVVTVSVIGLLDPLRVAVIVAVWSDVTAAVVAVKVAVVAPAPTVTEAGTVTAPVALLDNATLVPPSDAAFEIVTVHVVVEDAPGVVLPHCRDVTAGTTTSERFAVTLTPFSAPVTVAD